jgi:arylsulfatase A-like enzyme
MSIMKKLQRVVKFKFLIFALILSSGVSFGQQKSSQTVKPNIVFIYLDDLGYGDISCYGTKSIKTPTIDALANGGVRFTNGYATSATCTPSRYGLLTGVYPWRNKDAKILPGSAPLLIGKDQLTIPKMLKQKGYQTAVVGKWHLGLGTGIVDWNQPIDASPNDVGFDYSYIMAATQDRVPTLYIEDRKVVNLDPKDPILVNYDANYPGQPTGKDNPELLSMKWHHGHNSSIVNGIPRIGYVKGGAAANWSDVDLADHFLLKAQSYVKSHKDKPFFLFYALNQPHVPRTPHPRFVGKSGMGPRGDVILEADFCIGEIVKTLKEQGVFENTLIVFSSDNGPVLNDGYYDDAVEKLGNHKPNGPLRGGKYSLLEAGTRVPFFTYWKGKIKPQVSNALVCQIDLLESLAKLVDAEVKSTDSQNLLDVFMGTTTKGRTNLIIEANTKTAFRQGDWIMIPPYPGDAILAEVNIEVGNSNEYQLYNLKKDIGQKNNLAKAKPEILSKMMKDFESIRGDSYKNVEKIELK